MTNSSARWLLFTAISRTSSDNMCLQGNDQLVNPYRIIISSKQLFCTIITSDRSVSERTYIEGNTSEIMPQGPIFALDMYYGNQYPNAHSQSPNNKIISFLTWESWHYHRHLFPLLLPNGALHPIPLPPSDILSAPLHSLPMHPPEMIINGRIDVV